MLLQVDDDEEGEEEEGEEEEDKSDGAGGERDMMEVATAQDTENGQCIHFSTRLWE